MSSLLVLQTKDDILLASDTASSVTISEVSYRVSDNESKLFIIDKYIMFVSGNLSAQKLLMIHIKNNFKLDELESILKRHFIHLGEYSLEVVIAEKISDGTKLHTFSSYDSFNHVINNNTSNDAFLFTAGVKTKEIATSFESNVSITNNVKSSILKSYNENYCEQVGGSVEILQLSNLNRKIIKLTEVGLRRKLVDSDVHLIVGERIYGKIIMGVNLAIEDESGILKFRGSRGQIFDRNGNEVMRLGLVSDDGSASECFGLVSWNSITKVAVTDCEGISISRKKLDDSWEKIFWVAASDGTLYARDMVAERLKIVNDIGEEILNAETGYFDIGWFNKIVADGKLITTEKYELWNKVNTIMSEYQLLLSHANQYKYSPTDDTYDYNSQNPIVTKVSSSQVRVDTTQLTLKYQSLISFIGNYISIPPLFDDNIMERVDEIDRSTFAVRFKEYYDEYEKLRAAIENYLVYSGLQMGKFYNNLIMDSTAGFMAIRNDYKYRARLSATSGLVLEKWEGTSWVKKLYASLGDPNFEDGTLIAENLVAKSLRIVDGNLGDKIVLDQNTGISIYGDKSNIFLNTNDGIRIEVGGVNKFYVGIDGRLYAEDITTKGLKIVDGNLGEKIIFNQDTGITINGNKGEQIRLNANEGIAIDVNGDQRFWVGTDGLLYARRLVVVNEPLDEAILDTVTGSYISDLTVNKLRTLNSNSPQDHVFIKDNFIQLNTGLADSTAKTKFELKLMGVGEASYPHSTWGGGDPNGNDKGFIYKTGETFAFEYKGIDGNTRKIALNDAIIDSILIETPHNIRGKGKVIRWEVDANNYIEMTSNGIVFKAIRLDFN